MLRVIALALIALVAFTGGAVRSAAQNLGTVSVQVAPLGRVIPKNFSGFSIEVRAAARAYLGSPDQPNRVFFQLLKNLGTGSIRIGGDSQDLSCWNPQQAPQPDRCRFTITPADVQSFAQASAATGWPVIVGINLAQNSASWSVPYGAAVEKAFAGTPGSHLAGFEIGNEPDIFYRVFTHPRPPRPGRPARHYTQPRSAGWNWQELASEWRAYAAAFESDAATKNVPLIGPAICCAKPFLDTLGPFLDAVGPATFALVTVHNYPTTTCGGRTVTTEQLLDRATLDRWESSGSSLAAAVEHRGLPLRMEETNSASCSGQKDVSDTFAATAWGLDWMFANAKLGMTGVNFHMDVHSVYDAVAVETQGSGGNLNYTDSAWPLYYAIYAFAQLAEGRSLLPITTATSANIAAYAIRASSSAPVRVFLINKDMKAAGSVTIHTSEAMGQAAVLMVSAENLGSKQVRYGGVQFDNATGHLTGTPHETSINPGSQGEYAVELPNAAIAVVTIQPK